MFAVGMGFAAVGFMHVSLCGVPWHQRGPFGAARAHLRRAGAAMAGGGGGGGAECSGKSLESVWSGTGSSDAEIGYLKKHHIAKLVGLATTELTQERPENPVLWLAERLESAGRGELPRAERYLRSTNVVGIIDKAVRDLAETRPDDPFTYLGESIRRASRPPSSDSSVVKSIAVPLPPVEAAGGYSIPGPPAAAPPRPPSTPNLSSLKVDVADGSPPKSPGGSSCGSGATLSPSSVSRKPPLSPNSQQVNPTGGSSARPERRRVSFFGPENGNRPALPAAGDDAAAAAACNASGTDTPKSLSPEAHGLVLPHAQSSPALTGRRDRMPSFHNPAHTNSLAAGISSHLTVNYGGVDQKLREIEAFLDELKAFLIRDLPSSGGMRKSLEKFLKRPASQEQNLRKRAMSTPIRRMSSPKGADKERAGSLRHDALAGSTNSADAATALSGQPVSNFGETSTIAQDIAAMNLATIGVDAQSDASQTPEAGPLEHPAGVEETPPEHELTRLESEDETPLHHEDDDHAHDGDATPPDGALEQPEPVPLDLGEGVLTTLGILQETLLSCGRGTVSVAVVVADSSSREDFAKVIEQLKSLAHLTKSQYRHTPADGIPNNPSLSFRCEDDEQEEDVDLREVELDFVKFPVRTRHDDFRELTTETHILMWAKLQVKKEATAHTDRQEFEIFVNLVGSYTYSTLYNENSSDTTHKGHARYEVVPSFGQLVNVLSPADHKDLCNLERVIVSSQLTHAIHDFKLSLVRVAEHLIHTVIQGEFMRDVNRRISRSKRSTLHLLRFSENSETEQTKRRRSHADITGFKSEPAETGAVRMRRQSAAM